MAKRRDENKLTLVSTTPRIPRIPKIPKIPRIKTITDIPRNLNDVLQSNRNKIKINIKTKNQRRG